MSNFKGTPTKRAYAAAIRARASVLIMGDIGQAKTATLNAEGEAWGYHVETIIGSLREAADFLGMPVEKDGMVNYSPLGWVRRLNESKKGLLVLDELTTAEPSTMKAMLRGINEKVWGDEPLGDHVAIVAICNPADIAVDGFDLPPAMANRFMHLDWHFDIENWLNGVTTDFVGQKIDPIEDLTIDATETDKVRVSSAITAFLRIRPDMIHKRPTDDAAASKAWPSPRTWTNAMQVLAYVDPSDEDTLFKVLTGCVGDGAAKEYLAWLAAADLHDPIEVMRDPSIVQWKKERPDRLFALTTAVTAIAVTEAVPDAWTKAVNVLTACAEGGRPDVAMPGARTLLNRIPKGKALPAAAKAAFSDLLARTGRWAA